MKEPATNGAHAFRARRIAEGGFGLARFTSRALIVLNDAWRWQKACPSGHENFVSFLCAIDEGLAIDASF